MHLVILKTTIIIISPGAHLAPALRVNWPVVPHNKIITIKIINSCGKAEN